MAGRDTSGDQALEQWLFRYGIPNPLQAWRAAPSEKAADLAFRAIATDSRMLMRLDAQTARAMASQAEQITASIGRNADGRADSLYGAVSPVVMRRIKDWRARPQKDRGIPLDNPSGPESPSAMAVRGLCIPAEFRAIWGEAFDSYPHFDRKTGETVAGTVLGIGIGISKLKSPMDEIFAAVSARFAARCYRRAYRDSVMTETQCVSIVGTVQKWAAMTGRTPLMVGYHGRVGTYAERARMLAYDALACVDLAARLPGGCANPGLAGWELAAETHSYVSIALNTSMSNMDFDNSQALAAAAARFAASIIERPELCEPVDLPGFLELATPRVVLATVRRVLPNGVPPRRSESADTAEAAPALQNA